MSKRTKDTTAASFNNRFLNAVEKVGNAFPQPFLLFILCAVIVLIAAELMKGTPFVIPGDGTQMQVTSLLNRQGFGYILANLLPNFINFPLIPIIFVFTISIGVGEKAGFYRVVILNFFRRVPDKWLYFFFIFLSINGNIISDAALLLVPALGATLFIARGKNPMVAIMMGYAGYLAGLSANTLLAGTDVLVAGITESVLPFLPITRDLTVHPASNWFFMCTSSILLSAAATFVVIKFVEPMANRDKSIEWGDEDLSEYALTDLEHRGLRFAAVTSIVYIAVVLLLTFLPEGWLRNIEDGSLLPKSPFIDNVTVILAVYFFVAGLMYGIGAKTIRNSKDVADGMHAGVKSIIGIFVAFFFAAQFVDYFSVTNLASYMAISGADFLKASNFTGLPLLFMIILITAVLNFFVGTVGNKWALLAPILVPMLALLDYHPAFAQCVYRIGDAITNTINPISVYIPLMLMYMRKYKKNAGIGTLVVYQLPFAACFTITWSVQLVVWYLLNLPLGPLAPVFIK